jgi:CheY-like chemotaxis protein
VVPARSDGTQRVYTRQEVEQLRFVKRQIENGLSASDAHRLLEDEIVGGGLGAFVDPGDELTPSVLIAERDPYAAELSEYFLKTEGYEVRTALDADEARVMFEERSPHLVILDLLMSGGAGFRLCRQFSDGGSLHVLAVSVLDSAEEALTNGASAFLQKPLDPLQLLSMVRDLLCTSALTRATQPPLEPGSEIGLRNEEDGGRAR